MHGGIIGITAAHCLFLLGTVDALVGKFDEPPQ